MSHESPDSNDNNQSSIPDISSGQTKDLNDSNRTTESSISSSQTKELNSINTANSGEEKQPPNQSMDLVNEMYKMQLLQGASSTAARDKAEAKVHNYKFWATQPVPELDAEISENTYIQPPIPLAKLRSEPYSLPENYVWSDIEIGDAAQLDELYTLLTENYVEDDENMFRFDYSREFLKWALMVPGWHEGWHCGVRLQTGGRLLAFIAAIPATIRIYDKELRMAEINFLCVHKKLRSKRVAPVLIREITRRVNLTGIFQATFTAGIIIPKPIGTCRYWHRSLNPKKLIETNFSHVGRNMTLQRTIKLYKLPERTDAYLKAMRREFLASAYALLTNYLAKYSLAQIFSIEQFEHMMMPREDVIYSYVIETGGNVTDLISFYCLPSTIVNHPVHRQIKAAYSFYNVATTVPLSKLMHDALILAKNSNFDVFNALDLMENKSFLDELKFGIGDGNLQYYLYNWKCPDMKPEQIGLVLQ